MIAKAGYTNRVSLDDEPPEHLADVPRLMLAGDVGHRLLLSHRGVHDLVERKELRPFGQIPKLRNGRVERFLVFRTDEVERVAANRGAERRHAGARQMRLRLYPTAITGGKA